MPNAVQADWDLIREMFTNGVSLKEIERETGVQQATIRSRASRGRWNSIVAKAKAMLQHKSIKSVEIEAKTGKEQKLEAASDHVRHGLAAMLRRCVDMVQDVTLKTPAHAVTVASELEPLVRSAKTVFAWGEALSTPAIRIQVVAQCRLASEPAGYVPSGAVGTGPDKSILLAGPMGTGSEGAKPLEGHPMKVNMSPQNLVGFENVPHGTKPVLDVEVVQAEDYNI